MCSLQIPSPVIYRSAVFKPSSIFLKWHSITFLPKANEGLYMRKNTQVVTSLQTSCNKSVHKLSTSCVRTACSLFVVTSLEQVVNNL